MGEQLNWCRREDAVLRERYVDEGAAVCARELGRPVRSVAKRAARLGLVRLRPWTRHDDALLRGNWGDCRLVDLEKLLGRTKLAVYWRAGRLGLRRGCPEGFEYLTAAARRTGYTTSQLRRLLRWGAVKVRRSLSRPDVRAPRAFHFVDPIDVDDAIAAWHRTETCHVAAQRYGTDGETVRRWLEEARAEGVVMPPAPRRYAHWRVPSETIDRVVALRRSTETVRQAALRLRVNRTTLSQWLLAEGIGRPATRVWRLPSSTIDAVVARRGAVPAIRRSA